MEERFVILEHVQDRGHDIFEDILPAGMPLEQSKKKARDGWERLTDSEKKTHMIELAKMAVVEREFRGRKKLFVVSEEDDEHKEAIRMGLDMSSGYTPIIRLTL